METVAFNGWKNNVRLSNGKVELVVTREVGPRIVRFGFIGKRNLFAEIAGQQGGTGEKHWMIRGGHRLWIAPEAKPLTYELDNAPVQARAIPGGVRLTPPVGPISGVQKVLDIHLAPRQNRVTILHRLTNRGRKAISLAPWALTVMAPGGTAVLPLPRKIRHTERLTHNQEWSLWGYTDLSDPRWTITPKYIYLRQDRRRGPTKLGIAHREGWVAYQLGEFVFLKEFQRKDGPVYPDGGMNFETFTNEDFLELETLGSLVNLRPGATIVHAESWSIHRGVPPCRTDADVDRRIRPLV
jgi:hypothetical protein